MIPARFRQLFGKDRFARHFSFQMTQMLSETGARVLTVFALARFFDPALFGYLMVLLAIVAFFQRPFEGMTQSLIRTVAQEARDSYQRGAATGLFGAFVIILISLGTLSITLYGSTILYPETWTSSQLTIILLYVYTVFFFGKIALEAVFRGLKHFSVPARISAVLYPLHMIVAVVLLMAGMKLDGYLATLVAASGLNFAALFAMLVRFGAPIHRQPFNRERAAIRDSLSYSSSLVVRGFIGFFNLKVNVLIVATLLSEEQAGYYGFAERVVMLPLIALGAFVVILGPRIAEKFASNDRTQLIRLVHRSYAGSLAIALPFSIVLLLSPLYVPPLFPDFAPSVLIIQVFAIYIAASGFNLVTSGALMIYGDQARMALIFAVIGAVNNLVLVLLFINLSGSVGAALGTALSASINAALFTSWAHRLYGIPFGLRLQ